MSSRMPPVPPQSRPKRGGKASNEPADGAPMKDGKHPNASEQGDFANIHQNTSHKDFTGGSRGK